MATCCHATPALTADDERVLAEVEGHHAVVRRSLDAGGDWLPALRRRSIAGAIRGSCAIEGYAVSAPVAVALADGSAPPAPVPPATRAAFEGYRDAARWIRAGGLRYDETSLSKLHGMILRGCPDKSPGVYRRTGIVVIGAGRLTPDYVGPDASEVPRLMGELVAWLNEGDLDAHVLVRAAMAHLNLVRVHPWRDGNGRMSRCLQTLVIARDGRLAPEFCSIEEWLGHDLHTMEYYRALRETGPTYEPNGDAHGWMRFCLRAHHLQAQLVERRLVHASALWAALVELAERRGFPPAFVGALSAAAYGYLSPTTAHGVLRILRRAGVVAVAHGSGRHLVAAGEAAQVAEAVLETVRKPAVEPY